MSKALFAIALCAALAGCDKETRKADDRVLCNPLTSEAFFVQPGAGDTSFVRRNANLDAMCPTHTTQGQSNAK